MRWRSVWLTGCSALLLAGCGGDGAERRSAPGPRIDAAVAEPLAARSDEVARRLESGDPCGAGEEAARLRADLTAAINARRIPAVYLEDLSVLVNEIEAQIPPCVESDGIPIEPHDDGNDEGDDEAEGTGDDGNDEEAGKGEGKGKGKGKEKGRGKDNGKGRGERGGDD